MPRHSAPPWKLKAAIIALAVAVLVGAGAAYATHKIDTANNPAPLPTPVTTSTPTTNNSVTPTATPRRTTTPPTSTTTRRPTTTSTRTSNAAAESNVKCTNQIDYGSDPRDNATINSIGEQTGHCPKPIKSTKLASADPWVQGQIDWCRSGGMLPAVQPKDC